MGTNDALSRSLQFFDLEAIGEAEIENEFDLNEFVTKIIEDLRSTDPSVRASARNFFWRMKKDAANMSGHVVTGKKKAIGEDENGNKVTSVMTTRRVLKNIIGSNPHDRSSNSNHVVRPAITAAHQEGESSGLMAEVMRGSVDLRQRVGSSDPVEDGSPGVAGHPDSGRNSVVEGRSESDPRIGEGGTDAGGEA